MDKIEELLTRGVVDIIPKKEDLEKELRSGRKLRIYEGFDPTSPEFHIGHLVSLRKLKQWQDLGHEVIFLIGDFTGMIGDPTGKNKTRIPLTHEQTRRNAQTYKEQASRILKFEGKNPVKIKYNSEWHEKMSLRELARLSSFLTIQQVVERDMFQDRIKNNMNIAMSEFLYPFMQGYDSIAMDVDLEVGGSDQFFNMMTGRDLMHKIKRKNKFVMTTPLLTDAQGNKIGKTEGNAIAITGKPEDLFGQIMTLSDDVVLKGLEYLTDIPMNDIKNIEQELSKGENPIKYKKLLAYEIVKQLNNKQDAEDAQSHFESRIQKKESPEDLEVFSIEKSSSLDELLVMTKLALSKSEAKRLIEQGGVSLDGKIIKDSNERIDHGIIKVGKHKFVEIKIKNN